jgi:DNA (cytosine-5)-methyltransferase 1
MEETHMKYGSICSGIEAATVAWHPLGWKAVFYAEIDPFCNALLNHYYPDVPNRGDFTKIGDEYAGSVDVLVGGTPCQSFSVAGKRAGLDDPRGNLTMEYLRLVSRTKPRWIVWENVPGILSDDGGRTFGTFLGTLEQLGYGWAYVTLDAQYFNLAQRRQRVFVVGHLGDWRRAAAVLFDIESLCGNSPPSRSKRERTAYELAPSIGASGRGFSRTGETRGQDCVIPEAYIPAISPAIKARDCKGVSSDGDGDGATLIAHALRADGFDTSEDGTGRGTPIVPIAFSQCDNGRDATDGISPTLRSRRGVNANDAGGGNVAVAFHENQRGELTVSDTAGTLKTNGGKPGQGYPAVAFTASDQSNSFAWERDIYPTLDAQIPNDTSNIQKGIRQGMAVRRLTPRECERLQGFPDDWTLIPYGKRGQLAKDSPRYRALGNSMAVPCMFWLGQRIQEVDAL